MGLNAKNLKVSITPEMIPTMHEDKNEFYSGHHRHRQPVGGVGGQL